MSHEVFRLDSEQRALARRVVVLAQKVAEQRACLNELIERIRALEEEKHQ